MKALEQILYWASANYHPLYEQYLVEEHEEKYGPHYDEETAKCAVKHMYHVEGSEKFSGEHWTIEQIKPLYSQYRQLLDEEDTCHDLYVALNGWWHDMHEDFGSESDLIRAGIRFYFEDDDAPEGKIWYYMHAME